MPTKKLLLLLEQCKEYMLAKCTLDNSSRIIRSLAFESWDDNTKKLTLRLDSYEDYRWIIQPNVSGNLVSPAMVQFFGKGCCWAYSVPKPAI